MLSQASMATVHTSLKNSASFSGFNDASDTSVYNPTPSSSIIQAFATTTIDPDIDELGSPTDLNNFLPDSGALQHMTPRLADLFDLEEKLNIGVQIADGHIIKCTTVGKIQFEMLAGDDSMLFVALQGSIYIPGLSHHLFSITRFAAHGHQAIIQHNFVTFSLVNNINLSLFRFIQQKHCLTYQYYNSIISNPSTYK